VGLRIAAALLILVALVRADNKPERLEWFRDQGFGLFIHWSLDSQIGSVISHSMVGASDDYLKRFIGDLPKTFHPRKFEPRDWAALAKLAGVRYVVFTSKHHAGFCMFHTKTTDYSDREHSVQAGHYARSARRLSRAGHRPRLVLFARRFLVAAQERKETPAECPGSLSGEQPGLMKHDLAQVRELMTGYGNVDVIFFDGPPEQLRELAWELQPNTVVTRGAIETPEQYVPGVPLDGAWESCITMGTQWQYKPTNESYKSGGELISLLIETRAKGGNLLLNIGPKPDGEIPIEQEERLREIALWMFINGESIYGVRPWVITNENDYWFTKKKDDSAVYVIVKEKERWKYGEWKDISLRSIRATPKTTISVLGQSDEVLEYQPNVIPKTTWKQEGDVLRVRAMHAQRIYNDRKWPNPVVLKLTNVEPALNPPVVITSGAKAAGGVVMLEGEVKDLGKAERVEVGFEYRNVTGLDLTERPDAYRRTDMMPRTSAGTFRFEMKGWKPGDVYEVRAVVKHPLITTYGKEQRVTAR
jgi:alpha-L-fucosidase